jgi:predicted hotdog family 3-hydroxylacyl-ACP dehydratase
MLERAQIQALIPHQGDMCLWDRVLEWDAGHIVLSADNHRAVTHPLRGADGLHAVHLCEYGAQAMAVHGGLLASDGPARAGMLVALRDVQLHCARIDGLAGCLRGQAQLLAAGEASQQYAFRVLHNDTLLAEGRAAVMLQLPGQPGR